MATQFISAFIVIGLLVFLGVVMTVGVVNSKSKQVRASNSSTQAESKIDRPNEE